MRLKMAPNSLFAVLLRSPWWISFAIVIALALLSGALLPEAYRLLGMLSGGPFAVIGAIAAVRQLRAPSAGRMQATLEQAAAMPWRAFCRALEQAYGRQGYRVSRADGDAADLLLVKGGRSTLVVARRWKASNHGVETLRQLDISRRAQDASACVYITLLAPDANITRFAASNQVDLLNGTALAVLLDHPAAR